MFKGHRFLLIGGNQNEILAAEGEAGQTAELLRVSRRSVQTAAKVQQKGRLELVKAVDEGTIPISLPESMPEAHGLGQAPSHPGW